MNATNQADTRRRELARIHLAAKQLGMDSENKDPDCDYRTMLWAVARVRSAADLDEAGRRRVLDHLKAVGFKGAGGRAHPGRPHNIDSFDRGPMLKKIEALLADGGRPWAYVDGMAKRMFHVECVAFCELAQLRKLISALMYDQRRRKNADGPGL